MITLSYAKDEAGVTFDGVKLVLHYDYGMWSIYLADEFGDEYSPLHQGIGTTVTDENLAYAVAAYREREAAREPKSVQCEACGLMPATFPALRYGTSLDICGVCHGLGEMAQILELDSIDMDGGGFKGSSQSLVWSLRRMVKQFDALANEIEDAEAVNK